MIAFSLIIAIILIFQRENYGNKIIFPLVIVVLALMLIGEYFLAPAQNSILFYIVIIMAAAIFLMVYSDLNHENPRNRKEKILSNARIILFSITLVLLYGVTANDLNKSLFMGFFLLIVFSIAWLIQRRSKEDTSNEG